jgi:hypothetical protein
MILLWIYVQKMSYNCFYWLCIVVREIFCATFGFSVVDNLPCIWELPRSFIECETNMSDWEVFIIFQVGARVAHKIGHEYIFL